MSSGAEPGTLFLAASSSSWTGPSLTFKRPSTTLPCALWGLPADGKSYRCIPGVDTWLGAWSSHELRASSKRRKQQGSERQDGCEQVYRFSSWIFW